MNCYAYQKSTFCVGVCQYLRLSIVFGVCVSLFLNMYWVSTCKDILWRHLEKYHLHIDI